MKNFKMRILIGCLTAMACFACNEMSKTKQDFHETQAWERFQCAIKHYHQHEVESSLSIVDSLLDDDNYKQHNVTEEDNKLFFIHLGQLRTHLMAFTNNQPEQEKWARKTAEVCRSLKDPDDGSKCVQSEMDMYLGIALIKTGRTNEGFKVMDDAISQLDKYDSWESKQAQISFMHKIATQYNTVEYAYKLDSISKLALSKLSELSGQYGKIKDLTNEEELRGFVDFFTGKFLNWQAHAYLYLVQQPECHADTDVYLDSVRMCVDQAKNTDWGKSTDANIMLFDLFAYTGMYDEFEKSAKVVVKELGTDTLNDLYVRMLNCKSLVEEKQGHLYSALALQKRASYNAAKSYQNNIRSQMAQTIEAHQLDKERQSHLETRIQLQQLAIISILLVVLLSCSVYYYFYRQRKNKEIQDQFRAIIAKYESIDLKEADKTVEPTNLNNEEEKSNEAIEYNEGQIQLYAQIMTVMKEQKPYLDSDFDVNKLASLVFSNRTYVSNAINHISSKNFFAWLADYRNSIAIHAIRNNPSLSINDLCAITGHNSKEIFSRQFKQLNGITFTEFRKHLQ